jgi:hypothetical protein
MQVVISGEGRHDPVGTVYMSVNAHGFLIDLSAVPGDLVDPAILRVEWGRQVVRGEAGEAGRIIRRGESRVQVFHDRQLIEPYLAAWRARKAELLESA